MLGVNGSWQRHMGVADAQHDIPEGNRLKRLKKTIKSYFFVEL
ncbi:hypothetical protein [uncultured Acetatifactor sp.]|nr:hypothetical protein [uncultured Acetatifactor sp.]